MDQSTSESLRFPPVAGMTVRAEFDGGALSSDFGPLILRGVDQHIGLINRLVQAVDDRRHPSYVAHSLHDLFTQRIFQIACGYADGDDANALRTDPLFKLGVNRHPWVQAMDLASAPPSPGWRRRSRPETCIAWRGPSSISSSPAILSPRP